MCDVLSELHHLEGSDLLLFSSDTGASERIKEFFCCHYVAVTQKLPSVTKMQRKLQLY